MLISFTKMALFFSIADLGILDNPEDLGFSEFYLFETPYFWLLEVKRCEVSILYEGAVSLSILLWGLWLKFNRGGRLSFLWPKGLTDWIMLFSPFIHSFRSWRDILLSSSTSRHFLIKPFNYSEIFKDSLNRTGILVILSISSFSVLHSQGVSPWRSS